MSLTQVVPAGTRFRRHAHEGPHLCAVLDGGFLEHGRRTSHDVAAGMMRITPSARHDIDFGAHGARCLVLPLDAAVFAGLDRWIFAPAGDRLGRILGELAGTTTREEGEELACEVSAQLLRRVEGRVAPPPGWLGAVRERLRDGEVAGTAALAASVGVHRVHLARAFRDHYGVPVAAYRRRVQLRRASDLIRHTDTPLSRIAAETGFADQSHLTRAFQRAFGRPPAAWRRDATSVQDAGSPSA